MFHLVTFDMSTALSLAQTKCLNRPTKKRIQLYIYISVPQKKEKKKTYKTIYNYVLETKMITISN